MAKKTYKPRLTWNPGTSMWTGTIDNPPLVAKAPRTEILLTFLNKALRNQVNGEFDLEPEYDLPPELRTAVDEANECARQLEELTRKLPLLRTHAANIAQGAFSMMQSEAARLLNISQGFLARTTSKQGMISIEEETDKYQRSRASASTKGTRQKT